MVIEVLKISGAHPAGSFPGGKQPGREADYSTPSTAETKNGGATPPLPSNVFMALCLIT
jgi:hypothetical protein